MPERTARGPGITGWTLLSEGLIVEASESIEQLLGRPMSALRGRSAAEFIDPASAGRVERIDRHERRSVLRTRVRSGRVEPKFAPPAHVEWLYDELIPGSGWLCRITYWPENDEQPQAASASSG